MKKILIFLLLLAMLAATACTDPSHVTQASQPTASHSHVDEDDNGRCDTCQQSVLVYIDFYSINDLHGKFADAQTHPGVDELTSYFKQARIRDDYVILLSAGDMWQGSAESNLTKGAIITDWMNELDFTAMTMGNHEYDWGEEFVENNAAMAEFPFLAINIYDRETQQRVSYCDASAVVECGELQIGIIGAIGDCYSSISPDKTEGVYFKTGTELTALVKAESKRLRDDGVDFIVYMIHDGFGSNASGTISDSQLRSYYDISLSDGYVDLVFEGHSHMTYLLQDSYGVYHLQGGGDNKGITHAEIGINSVTGSFVITQKENVYTSKYQMYPGDVLIRELLDKYADSIAQANQVVGINSRDRNRDEVRQLVAQLYLQAGLEKWGGEYDIVLGGGFMSLRSPGYLAKGEITYGMLQSILPFDNELVLCSIRGSDLLSKFINTGNTNYFIAKVDNRQIDPNGTYYIIVDSYTSSYAPNRLTEIARFDAEVYARDLLADYLATGALA